MFDVSVDELLGYKAASTMTDIILELRKKIDSLPKGEDFDFTYKAAAALHAILFSKGMKSVPEANTGWDTEDAIEHAENAYTTPECISEKCGVSVNKIVACLDGSLSSYITENLENVGTYRFEGLYMNLLPLVSLFDFR